MGIDLNVVDQLGSALHHDYLLKQEECANSSIHSGVDLDDLGRSPSNISLEARLHSRVDMDNDSHAARASPMGYDTEMLDEAGKPYVKHFLIQQWMLCGEDESRVEVPHPDAKVQSFWVPQIGWSSYSLGPRKLRGIGVVTYALWVFAHQRKLQSS